MKTTILLAFALCFNLAYAQQNGEAQLTSGFDKVLSAKFRPGEPGAVALVARKGKIIYKKSFGMANLELNVPMQADNVFRIGSITKQFTAIAILQLMEQGKLSLQDEITKFIPDYPAQDNKITIEHLLTHTSGIQNYTSIKDNEKRGAVDFAPGEMIDYFKNQPIKFAPGTNWSYSNSNYFLLGYIIEKITGKSYAEYLDEHFFKPLGMNSSLYGSDTKLVRNRAGAYTCDDHGFENAPALSMTQPYAAGAIQSTVEDLFKWNQAVHSYRLVKKETLSKALAPYKLVDGRETAYGYGWRLGYVYEHPSVWHGGLINGFIAMELYLPEEDVFVAVFSNCDCNSPEVVASRLAALATGKPYEYKEIALENLKPEDYNGVYENSKGRQRIIIASGNKLYSRLGRGPASQLRAYQKDKFFLDETRTMEFVRNKRGGIEKLVSTSPGGNEVWNKTGKPIPDENGIKVEPKILEAYVGEYQVSPDFKFLISKEQDRLFLQAPQQEKQELFAETPARFFLKVNDAEFEFVKNANGIVTKAILNQGGRQAEAKKAK